MVEIQSPCAGAPQYSLKCRDPHFLFAYADKVYTALTDAQASQLVKLYGRDQAKLTVLSINNAHNDEHYGNIVTYLRIKGLVPPSSEPRK